MRICLASIHPRLLSGQIDALVGQARALRERGHSVTIVSAFAEDDLLDPNRAFGKAADAGHLAPRLARIGKIWRDIERVGAESDVVQINLPTPSFSFLADLLQARLRQPVVVGFEAHLPRLTDVIVPSRLREAPLFYLPRLLVNNPLTARLSGFRAAHYVVSSRLQAAELRRLGVPSEKISTIPNMIDHSRLTQGESTSLLDELPDDGPVISYVGHFNHVKGVDVLVRALPAVRQAYPNARLALAWSGLGNADPVRRAIAEANVADYIHMLGRVSVPALLSRSDVCVLPYRLTIGQAAFPGLVLEAMATGVPLVTSDLPLLRELVGNNDLALLARPEDPADLAAQIQRLLDDRVAAQSMVVRQRAAIAERFNPAVLAWRYEQVYGQLFAPVTHGQTRVLPATGYRRGLRPAAVREPKRRVG